MPLPRDLDKGALELQKIKEQFEFCAMYHPTFLEKPKLSFEDKAKLDVLAMIYQRYRDETGLSERSAVGVKILNPALKLEDWKSKAPLERYDIMNRQRADDLARFVNRFIEMNKLDIPGGNRLDIGASSCYFMVRMNELERKADTANMWFGTDIKDSRVNISKGTARDRDTLGFVFKEYEPGGELPFKDIKFGLETMFFTAHHVDRKFLKPDYKHNLIREAFDRLEPGGYLLMLEDNIGTFEVNPIKHKLVKMQDAIFYPHSPGEQATIHQWSKLLMDNGFEAKIIQGEVDMYNSIGILVSDAIICARKPL